MTYTPLVRATGIEPAWTCSQGTRTTTIPRSDEKTSCALTVTIRPGPGFNRMPHHVGLMRVNHQDVPLVCRLPLITSTGRW